MRDIELRPNTLGGGVPSPSEAAMTRAFNGFMRRFAESSQVTVRYALARAAEEMGILPIDGDLKKVPWYAVSSDMFSDLVGRWTDDRDLANATIRSYMHAVRGIARACFRARLMAMEDYHHILEVSFPRGRNMVGRGRAVEDDYRDRLISVCMQDERVQGVRDAAIIALLFGSGVRRAEVAGLFAKNLNIEQGLMQLRVKGGNTVNRYIQAWALPYLLDWRRVRVSKGLYDGSFFCGVRKNGKLTTAPLTGRGIFWLMEQRSIEAGLPFLFRPHDARRTMGTRMIEEYGELTAQTVLGHQNLSTTKIYDKRSEQRVRDIFRRADR